jgi:hypothetical protein
VFLLAPSCTLRCATTYIRCWRAGGIVCCTHVVFPNELHPYYLLFYHALPPFGGRFATPKVRRCCVATAALLGRCWGAPGCGLHAPILKSAFRSIGVAKMKPKASP